jgi:hypothetical protein
MTELTNQITNQLKRAVFWVLAASIIIALMMETASNSETLVNFYQITWY